MMIDTRFKDGPLHGQVKPLDHRIPGFVCVDNHDKWHVYVVVSRITNKHGITVGQIASSEEEHSCYK